MWKSKFLLGVQTFSWGTLSPIDRLLLWISSLRKPPRSKSQDSTSLISWTRKAERRAHLVSTKSPAVRAKERLLWWRTIKPINCKHWKGSPLVRKWEVWSLINLKRRKTPSLLESLSLAFKNLRLKKAQSQKLLTREFQCAKTMNWKNAERDVYHFLIIIKLYF